MESLKNLLNVLIDSDIDFVLIGGFAAVLYGSSQITGDIDICISLEPEQIIKLRKVLAPYHPVHRMTPKKLSFLEIPESLHGIKNLYIKTDLGTLDILGNLPGVGSPLEISLRAQWVDFFGKKIKIISLPDLIKSKQIVGRPKDLATVLELKVIQEKI